MTVETQTESQTESKKETLGFETEVKQLLSLVINSLYSNKEIFLRELISNASDACEKLRFEALSDNVLYEGDGDLKIRVDFDEKKRTITISDNGIGMSREEVIANIGTIARSGTQEFFKALTGNNNKDSQLIGQFGVGFYSAFIVADKLTLTTRRAGLDADKAIQWESAGEGEYTLEAVNKDSRGTEIVLHLKEGEDEFAKSYRLREVIRKFSDHTSFPIIMKKDPPPPPPPAEASAEAVDSKDEDKAEAGDNKDEDKAEAKEPEIVEETVNQAAALWKRSKSEITESEYFEFYKHVSHDYQEPLAYVHSRVEGNNEYTSLLYIPTHAPFDMWDRERKHGIKLYVRRVFIMDDADKLLPTYLRFVKGIIDSDDLPLNVSREILQNSKVIESIRNASVKKVLGLLENIAKNEKEKYATFWKEFGKVLKEGPADDHNNRERIAKLLRFSSTHTDTETQDISLDDYCGRMQEKQKAIYYVTAESFTAAKSSPHLEIFRKKGIEVLLMHERVDEWLTSNLYEFDGKQLQSVAKGELDLGDLEDKDEKEKKEKVAEEFKDFVERVTKILGDKVKEVRITHRLTASPACLVTSEHGMSANLSRILSSAGQSAPGVKPIMEINPDHALVQRLRDEQSEDRFSEWTQILFDQALLSEGGQLDDPAGFVTRLNKLLLVMANQ